MAVLSVINSSQFILAHVFMFYQKPMKSAECVFKTLPIKVTEEETCRLEEKIFSDKVKLKKKMENQIMALQT